MKFGLKNSLRFALLAGALLRIEAAPLQDFPTVHADATGRKLQDAFVWTGQAPGPRGEAVAFRKTFDLPTRSARTVLHLFADARYVLWVNGTVVQRGPNRFQPNGPEYDTIDLSPFVKAGCNVLAVLVVGNLSGGKIMRHAPGLTASLESDGRELLRTDATWKWNEATRFRKVGAGWANFGETLVDARVEDGDWSAAEYADASWKAATSIPGTQWGGLTARRIPLLRETPVEFTLSKGAALPVNLKAGETLEFETDRIVQAYLAIEMEADRDTEIVLEPFGVRYLAKAGRQRHSTLDTRGLVKGSITVKSGRATITSLKLVERVYPFDRVGSFTCSDPFLNRLWQLCARSCEVLSEDAYDDCADRERVEWMDCDPPGFDITRIAMAGPGSDGKPVYSDPRLLGEMVRRTGLTLQPEGWVKAHTCSDRYDIHAKMEDRACEWVSGIRRYFEATGDRALVREIWPSVVAQMNYFLARRTARGLVLAREWVVWGNPVGYVTLEGAGLNAFVYRALVDAAFLGREIGENEPAGNFDQAATDLAAAFNRVLWNEKDGTFFSGYFDATESAAAAEKDSPSSVKNQPRLAVVEGLVAPTVYAAIFALDRGIVSPGHQDRVMQYVTAHRDLKGRVMILYYLEKLLFLQDKTAFDREILDAYRTRLRAMVDAPAQCSWEEFGGGGGSKAHIYGMYPGYFLSAFVLGVRRDLPVADRKLRIEPHLGDLTHAEGKVVTEFGPVSVSWRTNGGKLAFVLNVPPGAQAELALPEGEAGTQVHLDGKSVSGKRDGARVVLPLKSGSHEGIY